MLYKELPSLLDAQASAQLLRYAAASEGRFEATGVGVDGIVRAQVRRSRCLSDLGNFAPLLESRIAALVPSLIADLKLTPFKPGGFETELVAHEDGAFYGRHIDLFTGTKSRAQVAADRLISVVLYLNKEPKAFSGGELRLYAGVDPSSDAGAVDIVPRHGMAVAFSSWMPHEVRPIVCPSGQFEDARFAINCWVFRTVGPTA